MYYFRNKYCVKMLRKRIYQIGKAQGRSLRHKKYISNKFFYHTLPKMPPKVTIRIYHSPSTWDVETSKLASKVVTSKKKKINKQGKYVQSCALNSFLHHCCLLHGEKHYKKNYKLT